MFAVCRVHPFVKCLGCSGPLSRPCLEVEDEDPPTVVPWYSHGPMAAFQRSVIKCSTVGTSGWDFRVSCCQNLERQSVRLVLDDLGSLDDCHDVVHSKSMSANGAAALPYRMSCLLGKVFRGTPFNKS